MPSSAGWGNCWWSFGAQLKKLAKLKKRNAQGNRKASFEDFESLGEMDVPVVEAPAPRMPKTRPGLHNQEWDNVELDKFKTHREVDMDNLSSEEKVAAKVLEQQGRTDKDIEQLFSSGDNFKTRQLKPGDKLYGFDSQSNPYGTKNQKSMYWTDETGYQDVKSKFYKDGVWDREGVKNYLALPCYNRADVIDTATVTQPHSAVESTIGVTTEQIGYTEGNYTTGMMGKIMPGGGSQLTPAAARNAPHRNAVMTLKKEIYQDINDNCDIVLNLLKNQSLTNDTAEGRMIYQCRWLKEQVAADALSFPVKDYVHTLKHVSAERLLEHLASSPDRYREEIGIYLYRLLYLIDGKSIVKPSYYSNAIRCIEALVKVLKNAARPLTKHEQELINELTQMKQELALGKIEPPLMHYLPKYPNFREVYSITGSSIDDLPNGQTLVKTVTRLLFEGIRPDTWITPDAADKETNNL